MVMVNGNTCASWEHLTILNSILFIPEGPKSILESPEKRVLLCPFWSDFKKRVSGV